MSFTADEWLSRLQRNLRGIESDRAYEDEAGSNIPTRLSLWSKSLTIVAAQTGLQYAQFIPPGYYDTVWITATYSVGPGQCVPVYARFEAIQSPGGVYALDGTKTQHMVRHPPHISGFINPQTGAATSSGASDNDLRREVPLTNAPLAVWLWDGSSSWPSLDTVITCTFMTLRH